MDLDVVKHAARFLKETVLLYLDPEVVLYREEQDVALEVGQQELAFGAEEDLYYLGLGCHLLLQLGHRTQVPYRYQPVLLPAHQVPPSLRYSNGGDRPVFPVLGPSQYLLVFVADLKENHVAKGRANGQVLDAVGSDDCRDADSFRSLVEGCSHVVQDDEGYVSDLG